MIALGTTVEIVEVAEVVQQIFVLTSSLAATLISQNLVTTYKIAQIQDYKKEYSELETEVASGEFEKVFTIDGVRKNWTEAMPLLMHEKVIGVKRCCCSLTGRFPSGILTVATWALLGTACRHEYVILYTTNYVLLIEIGVETNGSITKIIAKKAKTAKEKENMEKELTENKYWGRCLAKVEGIHLEPLEFRQVNDLITLWIHSVRAGGKSYTAIQKNCKSLARTILYFSMESVDYSEIVYSLFGIFTDKPLKLARVDMMWIEAKVFNKAIESNSKLKEQIDGLTRLLKCIRGETIEEVIT